MAVEPINGVNVNTNDYLQKNSQKGKNDQTVSKAPVETNNVANEGTNINPVTGSVKSESQNFMPKESKVNSNKDSLDLSNQAKNAYNNQKVLDEQVDNNNSKITNNTLNNAKNPQKSYTDMEDKM